MGIQILRKKIPLSLNIINLILLRGIGENGQRLWDSPRHKLTLRQPRSQVHHHDTE
jgi:hypothetical protein